MKSVLICKHGRMYVLYINGSMLNPSNPPGHRIRAYYTFQGALLAARLETII